MSPQEVRRLIEQADQHRAALVKEAEDGFKASRDCIAALCDHDWHKEGVRTNGKTVLVCYACWARNETP